MIFPNIPPKKIDFDFPTLLSQKEDFVGGYEKTFLNSSNGWGMTFIFTYKFLDSNQLKEIIQFYKQVRGKWKTFSLPHEIWRHPLPLRAELEVLLKNCAFRFDTEPKISPLKGDVYDLEFKLVTDIDLSNPWLAFPQTDETRVNIIVQDNIPYYYPYWEIQLPEYGRFRKDLAEEISADTRIYFLGAQERYLLYLFNLPPNYKKITNILFTTNSQSYTGSRDFFLVDRDTYLTVNSRLEGLNGKRYIANYLYFITYPENLPNDPILQDASDLSRNRHSTSSLEEYAISTNFINANIDDTSTNSNPGWGGNRDWMFQDIIDKLTP